MSDRICVIHIGTHKTGTTSQQNFLIYNWEELLRKSVLFVTAGIYEGLAGNHLVAWELLRETNGPQLHELSEELRASSAQTAILSAEDFSLLYRHPQSLEALAQVVKNAGYVAKILVYLRAQPPYIESHYVERVKHGHIVPLGRFLNEVLATGSYHQPGTDIAIEFEYSRLLAPFVDVFGSENVMVRVFGKSKDVGHVFQDFTTALTELSPVLKGTPFALKVKQPRANDSLTFAELLMTAHDRLFTEAPIDDNERFLSQYAPDVPPEWLHSRYSLLLREEWIALLERFGSDNESIAQRFNVAIPFRTLADIPDAGDPRWEMAALERAVLDRCLAQWLEKEPQSNDDQDQREPDAESTLG